MIDNDYIRYRLHIYATKVKTGHIGRRFETGEDRTTSDCRGVFDRDIEMIVFAGRCPTPATKSLSIEAQTIYKSWHDYDQPNRLNSLYTRHNTL